MKELVATGRDQSGDVEPADLNVGSPTTPCQICRTILTATYAVQFGDGLGDGSDGLLMITCERCYSLLAVVQEAVKKPDEIGAPSTIN